MNINELFTAKGFEEFLIAYHRHLHEHNSFPPFKGNKPLHVASKVLNLGGAESLRAALKLFDAKRELTPSEIQVTFFDIEFPEEKNSILFSTRENALLFIYKVVAKYLLENKCSINRFISENLPAYTGDCERILSSNVEFDTEEDKMFAVFQAIKEKEFLHAVHVHTVGRVTFGLHEIYHTHDEPF